MSINGKVEEGSMEIDSDNNLERFRTGSGNDEALEIHDFHIVSCTYFLSKSSSTESWHVLRKVAKM